MIRLTDQQRQDIEKELFAGRKISAIKLYREATGAGMAEAAGLADAARAVEQMDRELRKSSPERFAAEKKGCLGVVICLMLLSGAATAALTHFLR
jgi:ribosomal protein L7/L12